MNDLSSFIEQQRAAGSYESAGAFTLSIEKARDKLRSFSLINPEDYLLKLVQAAVSLGVEALNVQLLQRTVLLYFETPEDDSTVSVEAVARALTSPLDESNPARAYLTLAMCAVVGQEPSELMWGEWDSTGQGAILSLGGGRSEIFRDAPFPRTEPLATGRNFYLFYMQKKFKGIPIGQTAAEHSALTRRCAFAPMPIFIDGCQLEPSFPVTFPSADPVSELTSPYLGAVDIVADEEPSLRWPPSRSGGRSWRTLPDELTDLSPALPPVYRMRLPRDFETPMTKASRFDRAYGIPIYLYGHSQIYYVKDGVTLKPVKTHESGGGAFAILDGSSVKTDLTGLQVVVTEEVKSDIEAATEVWKVQIGRITGFPPPIYSNKPIHARGSTYATVFGCCLLGPLGLVAGPLYAFYNSRRSNLQQKQRKLQRQLEVRGAYLNFHRPAP